MLYFAMIEGHREGPFRLDQLAAAGVGPDTYIWCKGMDDWQQAGEVADICRHFRMAIYQRSLPAKQAAIRHDASSNPECSPKDNQTEEDPLAHVPPAFRRMVEKSGETPTPREESPNEIKAPAPTLLLAFVSAMFCFPLTGFIAIYWAWKARRAWEEAKRSTNRVDKALYDDRQRTELRQQLTDADRNAKMWIGITVSLGFIFYALMGRKFM